MKDRDSRRHWYYFGFIILSWATYAPSLFYDYFIFDDAVNIYQNKSVVSPTFLNFFSYWTNSKSPIFYNIIQIISAIFTTKDAYVFRIFNILLHATNVFLFYIIIKDLSSTIKLKKDRFSDYGLITISTMYLLHPIHVENIVWVSSLRTLSCATFGFLAIFNFLKFINTNNYKYNNFSFIFFLTSCLIKPSFIILPVILILIIWLKTQLTLSKLKSVLHYFIPAPFIFYEYTNHILSKSYFANFTISDNIIITLYNINYLIKSTLFPINLPFSSGLTPHVILSRISTSDYFIWLFEFILITALFIHFRKSNKFFIFSLSSFLICLVPNSGLFAFDFQQLSLPSNRYLYIPIFFIFQSLVILKKHIKKEFVFFVAFSYCLILLILTQKSIYLWSKSSNVILHSINLQKKNGINITESMLPVSYINSLLIEKDYQSLNQAFAEYDNNPYFFTDQITYFMHYLNTIPVDTNNKIIIKQVIQYIESYYPIKLLPDHILSKIFSLHLSLNNFKKAKSILKTLKETNHQDIKRLTSKFKQQYTKYKKLYYKNLSNE